MSTTPDPEAPAFMRLGCGCIHPVDPLWWDYQREHQGARPIAMSAGDWAHLELGAGNLCAQHAAARWELPPATPTRLWPSSADRLAAYRRGMRDAWLVACVAFSVLAGGRHLVDGLAEVALYVVAAVLAGRALNALDTREARRR